MTTATFKHNGTDIECRANGKFYAKTAAGTIEAPSLAAMKKKLDTKSEFQRFGGIEICNSYANRKTIYAIKSVVVVGWKQPASRWRSPVWVLENSEESQFVIVDTPANRAAVQALIEAMTVRDALVKEHTDKVDALRKALTYHHASEFKK